MANTERKARKRAGIKFTKAPKVGTPVLERMVPTVVDKDGKVHLSKRVMKARARQLAVIAEHDPEVAKQLAEVGQ